MSVKVILEILLLVKTDNEDPCVLLFDWIFTCIDKPLSELLDRVLLVYIFCLWNLYVWDTWRFGDSVYWLLGLSLEYLGEVIVFVVDLDSSSTFGHTSLFR